MSSTSKKKLSASDWCGRRETDTKPVLYLSGAPTSLHMTEEEFQKVIQYPYRCFTYPYIGDKSPFLQKKFRACFEWSLANGGRIMLDSGAHTFQTKMYSKSGSSRIAVKSTDRLQERRKTEKMAAGFLSDYIQWLHNYPARSFDFYVTFDWQTKCEIVRSVTEEMQRHGTRPIPAYHGDNSIDWLRRYVDEGHQLVGIGWSPSANGRVQRQRYYDQVFNFAGKHSLALHGFACTGRDMFNYPWYSVDSSSWLKAAVFGKIFRIKQTSGHTKLDPVDVSTRRLDTGFLRGQTVDSVLSFCGVGSADLRESTKARALYNVGIMKEMLKLVQSRNSRIPWRPLF